MRPPADAVELVRRAVRERGEARIAVCGDSMLPAVRPGQSVRILRRAFEQVAVGEVVAARVGGRLQVHRVYARDRDRLLTLGDNLPLLDHPVAEPGYLGVVDLPALRPPRQLPAGRPGARRRVHLWLFGAHRPVPPPGWVVHLLPRTGIGVAPRVVATVRAGTRTGLRIGVSEYAPAHLDGLAAAGTVHLLVGCPFGGLTEGDGQLLPLDLADGYVRVGPLLEPVGAAASTERLAAALAGTLAAT
jgi:Peptidase S24-like